MSFHFFLSATKSLHLLTPSTWRSLSTSSFQLFLGLPFLPVPPSSWVKIFLFILSSSILSRWPNQLILCPFIHFTIFSPLFISSSSRFVWINMCVCVYICICVCVYIYIYIYIWRRYYKQARFSVQKGPQGQQCLREAESPPQSRSLFNNIRDVTSVL